jgi:hypothetical protein
MRYLKRFDESFDEILTNLTDGNFDSWIRIEDTNENNVNITTYTMFTGISRKLYDKIWKNKNLINKETNVTDNFSFALDYSYDFDSGKYDDIVLQISNIPLNAFVGYRKDNYKNDEDFKSMLKLKETRKIDILNTYSLFLVNLYKYKDIIETKLFDENKKEIK